MSEQEYIILLTWIVIGILFVLFFVLVYALYKERDRSANKENELRSIINYKFDSASSEINSLDKSVSDRLSNLNTQISAKINKSNDKINEKFLNQNSRIDKAEDRTKKLYLSSVKLISDTKEEIIDIQTQNNNDLKKFTTDTVNDSAEKIMSKVSALSEMVKELANENSKLTAINEELRKKLEFYTEIDSDSKLLNYNEDREEDSELKQKVAEEIHDIFAEPFDAEAVLSGTTKNKSKTNLSTLDAEQQQAIRLMEKTDNNIFITGKAGTGKSFLLNSFVDNTSKKVLKLAPTGIAALNIEGVTLHSALGFNNLENLDISEISRSTIKLSREKQMLLKELDTVIIDEMSMVRADTFDKINKILQIINNNVLPFGGKQVILFGDLFQLPPIAKKAEHDYLEDRYGGIFFFCSEAYKDNKFNFIELTTNHRQKSDNAYFEILNRVREGKVTSEDIDTLNSRKIQDVDTLRRTLQLFPTKSQADSVNSNELRKIENQEFSYPAKIILNELHDQIPNIENIFPISKDLRLKRGALVMIVVNDKGKRFANGTLGIVKYLEKDKIVVTINSVDYDFSRCEFSERQAIYEKGKIKYKEIFKVEQFPVVLAYAITVHKSQGMTYQRIACDVSRCFAAGQAYVALSRCRSLEGLFLEKEISSSAITVDSKVQKFYAKQLEVANSQKQTISI